MADLNFRDFAGAHMQGDDVRAATVLETLLALSPDDAKRAAAHFRAEATRGGPAFMGQAMGLRTAVTGGDAAQIAALLFACFGLMEPALAAAITRVRAS